MEKFTIQEEEPADGNETQASISILGPNRQLRGARHSMRSKSWIRQRASTYPWKAGTNDSLKQAIQGLDIMLLPSVVEQLIEKGANANEEDVDKLRPLDHLLWQEEVFGGACRRAFDEAVKRLREAGAMTAPNPAVLWIEKYLRWEEHDKTDVSW